MPCCVLSIVVTWKLRAWCGEGITNLVLEIVSCRFICLFNSIFFSSKASLSFFFFFFCSYFCAVHR